MLTVTGPVTEGLKSTAQVIVTSEPTGRMGVAGLLVTLTEVGAGTEEDACNASIATGVNNISAE